MAKRIVNLNLLQKFEVIEMREINEMSVKHIAKHFRCGTTQIYECLKNKESIKKKYLEAKCNDLQVKKLRESSNKQLNDIIYDWFCIAKSNNFPVSGPILQSVALEVARCLNLSDFRASNGWLRSFKNSRRIVFRNAAEESSVEDNSRDLCRTKLEEICKDYDVADIANCDETGLFYRALPSETAHLKGEMCSNGELSDDRVTILFTVFADGSILRPSLVAKSNSPSCFKNLDKTKLKVDYHYNDKAWMTTEIFYDYLIRLNQEMIDQDRNILLFLDSASCHGDIELSNIKLEFLSEDSTVIQPCNGGFIRSFKVNYRISMMKYLLAKMEGCDEIQNLSKTITLLDAIDFIDQATKNVTPSYVQKCFENCGFPTVRIEHSPDSHTQHRDVEMQNIIQILCDSSIYAANDYVDIDGQTATEENFADVDNLVEQIVRSKQLDCDALHDTHHRSEDNEPDKPVTKKDVFQSLQTLEEWSKQNGDNDFYGKTRVLKNMFIEKFYTLGRKQF